MPFASNFKLKPRFVLFPSDVTTMKLDVILDNARPDMPSICATWNEGRYRADLRWSTIALNFSFSCFSVGKN